MKKIMLMLMMIAGTSFAMKVQSQIRISVNIGIQPDWGPSGYNHAEYYYLPDIDVYYYVPRRQFIYLEGNNWIFAASLPSRFRYFDLYTGYKVVINDPYPYRRPGYYRSRYAGFRGRHDQDIIRDNRSREHNRGGNNRGRGRGHGRGHH
ncbi:MAG: hypothetical protein IPP73_05865 [Chitinophagaceae bacterium]|nr:hypothetical protein [Chitinophagaceae bacterium]